MSETSQGEHQKPARGWAWRPWDQMWRETGWTRRAWLILIAAAVPVALWYRSVPARGFAIEPISVPPDLEKSGYTSTAVAGKLTWQLRRIQENALTKKDATELREFGEFGATSLETLPDIKLPWFELSLDKAYHLARRLLNKNPARISGAIVSDGKKRWLSLWVSRETELVPASAAEPIEIPSDQKENAGEQGTRRVMPVLSPVEDAIEKGAEQIMRFSNPYVLANYCYKNGRTSEATDMARRCIRLPPEVDDAWAYGFLGFLHYLSSVKLTKHLPAELTKCLPAELAKPLESRSMDQWRSVKLELENLPQRQVWYTVKMKFWPNDKRWRGLLPQKTQRSAPDSKVPPGNPVRKGSTASKPVDDAGLSGSAPPSQEAGLSKSDLEDLFRDCMEHEYGLTSSELEDAIRRFARAERQTAIDLFSHAIELNSNLPHLYNNRGNAYRDDEKLDDAICDFKTAVRKDPQYAKAQFSWANTLEKQGDKLCDAHKHVGARKKYLEAAKKYDEAYQSDLAGTDGMEAMRLKRILEAKMEVLKRRLKGVPEARTKAPDSKPR
jgi:tetratricopeptide (TPR) repeat protein